MRHAVLSLSLSLSLSLALALSCEPVVQPEPLEDAGDVDCPASTPCVVQQCASELGTCGDAPCV